MRQSRYVSSPIITLHYLPSCKSTGDILRELDNLSVLTGESFLLVNAGAITNLDLAPVWKEHEARLKESSFNIMTSIFTHTPYTSNAIRSRDLAMILNSDNRILAYNDLKKETLFPILTKSLLENDSVGFRLSLHRRRPCVSTSLPPGSICAATKWWFTSATTTTTRRCAKTTCRTR